MSWQETRLLRYIKQLLRFQAPHVPRIKSHVLFPLVRFYQRISPSPRPAVVYGCETWSLTLREEGKLRVLENRVLRRIFGSKTDEVTGEWRQLHNEELNYLYSSPNIFRVIKSRRI
jgi:hypothetical protein